MFQFGYNNWIKYGWGEDLSSTDRSSNNLIIDFSNYNIENCRKNSLDYSAEAIQKVTENYKPPYHLMVSGGIDSQAMILAWKMSNVDFTVNTVRYLSKNIFFNFHDLRTLYDLCSLQGINIREYSLDIINFLNTELKFYSDISECYSPQICTYMKFADLFQSGTLIFSGNICRKQMMTGYSWDQLGLQRYADYLDKIQCAVKILPFFLAYTPELNYSFKLKMQTWESGTNAFSYINKVNLYKDNGFNVIPQPKKFNGFEELKNFYDNFVVKITKKQKMIYSILPSNRNFDYLFRYSLGTQHLKGMSLIKTCKEE